MSRFFLFSLFVLSVSATLGLGLGDLANCPMNTAWASQYSPPRYYQGDRGTCWAFATIGILEESYRQNGFEKGYLRSNEYVRFSEQGFGISMIDACKKHPESCNDIGDFVVQGSPTGGEIYWIYLFPELYSKVLPAKACPYYETEDPITDVKCDNYAKAITTNPIKFNITSMVTTYNAADTRKYLLNHNKTMGWSVLIHDSFFYFPCNDPAWSNSDLCSVEKRTRCPSNRNYNSEYCAVFTSPMYNTDGEFSAHDNMYPAGGHAMNVVGFNDNFVTKAGSKGGFIIKNSWYDKAYLTQRESRGVRGSHSIQYWMQTISVWDDRSVCPNAENPNHWASCTTQEVGPTKRVNKNSQRENDYIFRRNKSALRNIHGAIDPNQFDLKATCLNSTFMNELVNLYFTPSEFSCVDESFCSKDPRYRYFLIDMIRSIDGWQLQVNMLQYDTLTSISSTIELPFMYDGLIPYFFTPIDDQKSRLVDSEDLCGFYFWPYDLLDRQVGLFGGFSAVGFDIDWDDKSYLVNRNKCPGCDYSYLSSSTGSQTVFNPMSTNPWNKVRYDV